MSATRHRTTVAAFLAVVGVAMAGCGDDSSDGDAGGSGGSAASAGDGGSGAASQGGSVVVSGGSNGTGADGTGANGSGANGTGGTDACATTTQKADPTPANLLFVIDKSGSMNCNPPEGDEQLNAKCASFPVKEFPDEPSKWEVTTEALANALDSLVEQSHISAGVTLFPTDDACGVAGEPNIAVAQLDADGRTAIADLLDGTDPEGETPYAGATILSYAHLSEQLKAGDLAGNTFVVLLTDGAETCKPEELPKLVDTDVPNARLFDIRTFVIGAPGSEQNRARLSQIAFEGGTASSADCDHSGDEPDVGDCHFDMTTSTDFAADLNQALLEIAENKVLSCEFEVPTNPDGGGVDRNKVNVTFTPSDGDPEQILKDDSVPDCADAEGWQYSEDGTKLVLCGEVCDRVKADPEAQVDIVLGCPTQAVK